MAIYAARPEFSDLIERAGLSTVELARATAISQYSIYHIAAGRRRASGAHANRIAKVYAAHAGVSHDAALEALFVRVAAKKGADRARQRGPGGRFVASAAAQDGGEEP